MAISAEQTRLFFNTLLDHSKNKLGDEAIPWKHMKRNVAFTLEPVEFTDNKTSQTFYGLVHVFVSEEKEDVTKLVAELGRIQRPR